MTIYGLLFAALALGVSAILMARNQDGDADKQAAEELKNSIKTLSARISALEKSPPVSNDARIADTALKLQELQAAINGLDADLKIEREINSNNRAYMTKRLSGIEKPRKVIVVNDMPIEVDVVAKGKNALLRRAGVEHQ